MNSKILSKIGLSLFLLLGLFLSSCTNSTEPVKPKQLVYNPTVQEAQQQSDAILNETVKQLSESMAGYSKIPVAPHKALGKVSDSRDYYYFDGWHIWRGEIDKNPFGIPEAYAAEYLAKIQFKDSNHNVKEFPDSAAYMGMYLQAHAAFGFVDGQPYGDEVWYNYEGNATPLSDQTTINGHGTYERRWAGVYNGEDTELHYKLEMVLKNLVFTYDFHADDYTLNGNIVAYVNNYNGPENAYIKMIIRFNNSRTGLIEVYMNGSLVKTYSLELPNFYQIYNLPSLKTWNFGSEFNFPAPIPLD
ncbi:hypothetical protein BMS3Abin04_01532 [bacterium BMS3Abin04]|nr:hypothetical protein BMS3Abin04_01532 [bacterium BMS3Abin04]